MGMPARALDRRWTEQEFYEARDAAPPGERWELVDAEVLVTPSPNWVHQRIIARLFRRVDDYIHAHELGEAFLSPLDVKLEPGLVLQPDLLVVRNGELRRREDIIRHLLLAIEIVSPSSARHDRVRKRPAYQRNRVPEYWIVDDMSQTFERWTPYDDRPELLAEQLTWHPAGASEPFALDLIQFFSEVAAEDDG
jgi:Uma2 family endonuclease